MSDAADEASQLADDVVARALANRVQKAVTVLHVDCTECGDPIEEKRREVLPGTEHCAACATYLAERDRVFKGVR